LIRAEPLLLKPGQFYAFAALTGAGAYAAMTLHWKLPAFQAAVYARWRRSCFVFWRSFSTGKPAPWKRRSKALETIS